MLNLADWYCPEVWLLCLCVSAASLYYMYKMEKTQLLNLIYKVRSLLKWSSFKWAFSHHQLHIAFFAFWKSFPCILYWRHQDGALLSEYSDISILVVVIYVQVKGSLENVAIFKKIWCINTGVILWFYNNI